MISNGEVATGGGVIRCDLGVRDGQIVALADRLDTSAAQVIDATGMLVMPGGVDSHVHIDQPSGSAAEMCDDFDTASASAAAGGTTSVICFAWQSPGESLAEVAEDYARRARNSRVD